jgi:4-amino-4-deoxy-L-arabinose transferase-like glycosyltransferase
LGLTFVRLAFIPAIDALPQEAYYFLYSRHLALSYFDHPPVVAYAIRLFSTLVGPSLWAPRLTALTLTLGTQLCFLSLARRVLQQQAEATSAAVVFSTTFAISLLSLISLPDVPLVLFWSLALLGLWGALFEGRATGWAWAGLFMGLAFDSKYTGLLLQVGMFAFVIWSPEHRKRLSTAGPWVATGLAQLVSLPVYLWNAQHHFVSFAFQFVQRAEGVTVSHVVPHAAGFVSSQVALLLPPLLAAIGVALLKGAWPFLRGKGSETQRFLWAFSAPLALGMLAICPFTVVKPNWALPAYVTGTLLAAPLLSVGWRRVQLGLALLVHVVLAWELLFYPVPLAGNDTWMGWKELGDQVSTRVTAPGTFVFTSEENYKIAAELRFYTSLPVYAVNVLGKPALAFDYLGEDLGALKGQDGLLVQTWDGVSADVRARFASVTREAPIPVHNRGKVERTFYVFRCSGYRGP